MQVNPSESLSPRLCLSPENSYADNQRHWYNGSISTRFMVQVELRRVSCSNSSYRKSKRCNEDSQAYYDNVHRTVIQWSFWSYLYRSLPSEASGRTRENSSYIKAMAGQPTHNQSVRPMSINLALSMTQTSNTVCNPDTWHEWKVLTGNAPQTTCVVEKWTCDSRGNCKDCCVIYVLEKRLEGHVTAPREGTAESVARGIWFSLKGHVQGG